MTMRVRYVGVSFGVDGLTDQSEYEVLSVDEVTGYFAVVDESGEDYLYHPKRPQAIAGEYKGGRFEIVEDDEQQTLHKAIYG